MDQATALKEAAALAMTHGYDELSAMLLSMAKVIDFPEDHGDGEG